MHSAAHSCGAWCAGGKQLMLREKAAAGGKQSMLPIKAAAAWDKALAKACNEMPPNTMPQRQSMRCPCLSPS